MTTPHSGIDRLLEPRSIAVIGASTDPRKLTGMLLSFLGDSGFEGAVYPVNPRSTAINGLTCYPSVSALPEVPDVAVIGVPGDTAVAAVRECAAIGVPAVVMLSGGFGEGSDPSPDGARRTAEVTEICRNSGLRLVGPNTTGVVNFERSTPMTFADWYARDTGLRAGVEILAGSGTVGGLVFQVMQRAGVGVNHWIGVGNELDLTMAEFIDYFAERESTRVIVCYAEGLVAGRAFFEAAVKARRAGKSIVVLTAGRSDASRRSMLSHTGKVSSSSAIYSGIFAQLGIVETRSIEETAYVAKALLAGLTVPDGRIGMVSASGGIGTILTDQAESAGLHVDRLPDQVRQELAGVVPLYGAADNPIDLSADAVFRPELFSGVLDVLGRAEGVPGTWIVAGRATIDRYYRAVLDFAARGALDVVVCPGIALAPEVDAAFAEAGVAVLDDSELCMRALGRIAAAADHDPDPQPREGAEPRPQSGTAADPVRVDAVLRDHGVPLAASRFLRDEAELRELMAEGSLTYPVAVKSATALIAHRSDVGCVVLGVTGEAELARAVAQVRANAALAGAPDATVEIQEMSPVGAELLVGIGPDPDFGAVATVALGGVTVEVAPDAVHSAMPASRAWLDGMVGRLRSAALLQGYRGRAAVKTGAIADLLTSLWAAYQAHPEIAEIELNPVIVDAEDGSLHAVDALVGLTDGCDGLR
ncbi:acetate--CoA ligase family protein [Nocardioides sp.]|jgi:acyl-CoA synthetase (NDP forming)|uniref:acetate--CoA ligase family protein n=1 Tax=Nocardioides sp. TaxID=35761 RepID=UPI002BA5CC4A|nr:acetate--CoA ligase family protein [Nocardioides sp.]HVX55657.1 acetate--CoA ligase family protein [Nocardioides sp.]